MEKNCIFQTDIPDAVRARSKEMSSTVARLLTGLHFHSFTYDYHLRMLANFLSGRDMVSLKEFFYFFNQIEIDA